MTSNHFTQVGSLSHVSSSFSGKTRLLLDGLLRLELLGLA